MGHRVTGGPSLQRRRDHFLGSALKLAPLEDGGSLALEPPFGARRDPQRHEFVAAC